MIGNHPCPWTTGLDPWHRKWATSWPRGSPMAPRAPVTWPKQAADGKFEKKKESRVSAHSVPSYRNGADFCNDNRKWAPNELLQSLQKSILERKNSVIIVAVMVWHLRRCSVFSPTDQHHIWRRQRTVLGRVLPCCSP